MISQTMLSFHHNNQFYLSNFYISRVLRFSLHTNNEFTSVEHVTTKLGTLCPLFVYNLVSIPTLGWVDNPNIILSSCLILCQFLF